MSEQYHWQRLSNGFDVELNYGVPVKISDNGKDGEISPDTLIQEIRELTGFNVNLGEWGPGENSGEHEALLNVSHKQLDDVLRRFAIGSASVFVDRFGKAIDSDAVDWDSTEYAYDFNWAMKCCNLNWSDVDKNAHFAAYAKAMHEETLRLVQERP